MNMTRFLTLIIILCSTVLAGNAAENRPDTVLSVKDVNQVSITDGHDGLKVTIKGNGDDESQLYTFEEKYSKNVKLKSRQWNEHGIIRLTNNIHGTSKDDIIVSGLCFGMVNAIGAPSQAGFELGKSWEISMVNMLAYRRAITQTSYFSIGFGMDWRTYRNSKGTTRFGIDDNGKVVCGAFQEGCRPEGSQIKVVRAGFPIMWQQYLGNSKSSFQIGAILNMTTHASVKSKWTNEAGNSIEEYNGNLNTRFFTVDIMGTFMFNKWIGIYGRWTPQSVLRTSGNASPKFSTLSFGLTTLF